MPQSLANLLVHIIFSTKNREPLVTPDLMPRLHAFLGGIVRTEGSEALGIGGTEDHVHLLVRHPPRIAVSDLVRVIKSVSSRWVHEELRLRFGWQSGYGAFSVSQSSTDDVLAYIANQAEHHRKLTFQEEFRAFLTRHNLEFDERYLWD